MIVIAVAIVVVIAVAIMVVIMVLEIVPAMIRILDDMPMTATGKLRKVELRQAYGDYFAAKSA